MHRLDHTVDDERDPRRPTDVASRGERHASGARARDDVGSTSLTVALLTPLFVVLMFAAVQAALWGHARTEARVAAKSAAAQVARQGASPGDAQATALANLADSGLRDISVSIARNDGLVVVTVSGDAPGILIGTSRPVSVTEAVPIEEITPR